MPESLASENGFTRKPGFEWGAIGRESVKRVGVIDVGSNSVRLVVFDGVARAPAYFYNEKILCGLGAGIHETGKLNPEGRERAMAALKRFMALAERMQLRSLHSVATAAVREATDGPDFVNEVRETTGLQLHVASGPEEGQLSAKGVLLGWPHANGLVCDMGGASMELARVEEGVIGVSATSPLGPLQLANLGSQKAVDKEISRCLKQLVKEVGGTARKIYLVGGSWRAIARLDMERRNYPLKVLHEYNMTPANLTETADWIASQQASDLKGLTDTSMARLELVPLAARVLSALVDRVKPQVVAISSYGIREGMLYEMMPDTLRSTDPLLEAARHMEQTRARFPGFADSLYDWLLPLFRDISPADQRLMKAACYLHDISWRSHPDYRHEVCFETVTRANLSGVDHQGRVFLGVALINRYKSGAQTRFDPAITGLLAPERHKLAESIGKAIRLGAMLSGAAPGSLENTRLSMDDNHVTLTLWNRAQALRGEAVDRRLGSLAQQMGREGRIVLEDSPESGPTHNFMVMPK